MKRTRGFRWLSWFTLMTYGRSLLCNDAASWMFSVRLVMLFLIGTECASWGYAAWHIVGADVAPFFCAFAVLTAFTLNWTLDGSIMTIDRDRSFAGLRPRRHEKQLLTAEYKLVLLAFGRLMMISAVLYASSSFLVEALFNKDISNWIANENRGRIETRQQELLAPLDKRRAELTKDIRDKNDEITREARGLSADKMIGCREICQELQAQRNSLQVALKQVESQQSAIRSAFEQGSPAELKEKYHLDLLGDGIEARGEVIEKLKHNDNFKRTEWSVQGALLILFVGLLLLKLYQPSSVLLYYSAALQELYERYLDGRLNHLLQTHQLPGNTNGGMTPFEFAKWAQDFYLPGLLDEQFRQEIAVLEAEYAGREQKFKNQQQELVLELEALDVKLQEVSKQELEFDKEIRQASSQVVRLNEKVRDAESERNRLSESLSQQGFPTDAYAPILDRISTLNQQIHDDLQSKQHFEAKVEDYSRMLAQNNHRQEALTASVAELQAQLNFVRNERTDLQHSHIERLKELWSQQNELRRGKAGGPKSRAGRGGSPGWGPRKVRWS